MIVKEYVQALHVLNPSWSYQEILEAVFESFGENASNTTITDIARWIQQSKEADKTAEMLVDVIRRAFHLSSRYQGGVTLPKEVVVLPMSVWKDLVTVYGRLPK